MSFLIEGTFIHTKKGILEILENHFMLVSAEGKIAYLGKEKPDEKLLSNVKTTYKLSPTEIAIPGFIDCHIHAPQYINSGCGANCELLEWLNKYTFPAESKFNSTTQAEKIYTAVVSRTLSFGTTTASYFATIHKEASILLGKICAKLGQRAFVGKISMDRNSPDYYIEKTQNAIEDEKKFLEEIKPICEKSLVLPVITPRFVPSCTAELMSNLGEMGKKSENKILIQSHLNENESEIALVKELHPESKSYTHVYNDFNLLTDRTILAHCIHMTDSEIDLMVEKGASVAHCPSSNFNLNSGCCDVRYLLQKKLKVGLGTDVSGGPSPSIIDSMRNAIMCSKAIYFEKRKRDKNTKYKHLNVDEVFYLATEGGANALGIGDKVGNFEIGKEFDGLFVDLNKGALDCFGHETAYDLLNKMIFLADDRNIVKVFVQGKIVKNLE